MYIINIVIVEVMPLIVAQSCMFKSQHIVESRSRCHYEKLSFDEGDSVMKNKEARPGLDEPLISQAHLRGSITNILLIAMHPILLLIGFPRY